MSAGNAITDVPFDLADDVGSIRYRLHPLDVGFDLRDEGMVVAVAAGDDPLRVSYPGAQGERRVIEGPAQAVLRRLRARGFRFEVRNG